MGSLFRSEEVTLLQLAVTKESAHDVVDELARLECLHFQDLQAENMHLNRSFTDELQRVDEVERKLRYVLAQRELLGPTAAEEEDSLPLSTPRNPNDLDQIAEDLESVSSELKDIAAVMESLVNQLHDVEEEVSAARLQRPPAAAPCLTVTAPLVP